MPVAEASARSGEKALGQPQGYSRPFFHSIAYVAHLAFYPVTGLVWTEKWVHHRLHTLPEATPVSQERRYFGHLPTKMSHRHTKSKEQCLQGHAYIPHPKAKFSASSCIPPLGCTQVAPPYTHTCTHIYPGIID
jgi:hypothetical protein